jgi:type IV secretion system protein TrbL
MRVRSGLILVAVMTSLWLSETAFAQEGSVLTELENDISAAAQAWEVTILSAARRLFWVLAGIEISVAAVWLALQAASLDSWFAEIVRRIMFVGFFAFVLDQGPDLGKAIVDSLYEIGAGQGTASPAMIFDAGLRVAGQMSSRVEFGLFEDNALAIAAAIAMGVVVICFSLVAALFVSVMVEMYVGLLAGMIMLGLGGSTFTKDFAIRYLVYAFSVGMKLMALVMIANIGADVLLGLSEPDIGDEQEFMKSLAIAGVSVVVFLISMYVPNIMQGVVKGVSIASGGEALRHGGQAAQTALGAAFLGAGGIAAGFSAGRSAYASGATIGHAVASGIREGIGASMSAVGSAAREKSIGAPGAQGGSTLGLANAKLDDIRAKQSDQDP